MATSKPTTSSELRRPSYGVFYWPTVSCWAALVVKPRPRIEIVELDGVEALAGAALHHRRHVARGALATRWRTDVDEELAAPLRVFTDLGDHEVLGPVGSLVATVDAALLGHSHRGRERAAVPVDRVGERLEQIELAIVRVGVRAVHVEHEPLAVGPRRELAEVRPAARLQR